MLVMMFAILVTDLLAYSRNVSNFNACQQNRFCYGAFLRGESLAESTPVYDLINRKFYKKD